MKDFTLESYKSLLIALKNAGYSFLTFEEYLKGELNPVLNQHPKKIVLLRHDVDKLPENSLATAEIENELTIASTYYFRIVKESNHPAIIRKIKSLGHEIGYHYEDLALCKGDLKKAIVQFENNLNYFRSFYPVSTICMHGSPLTKWDNRLIWEAYDYKQFNLIGEPYFDIDFNKFLYLTDTGRKWDGDKEVIRDKVKKLANASDSSFEKHSYHSTFDIISKINTLPSQVMITTHPQRWTNNSMSWIKELILQNIKNTVKKLINR